MENLMRQLENDGNEAKITCPSSHGNIEVKVLPHDTSIGDLTYLAMRLDYQIGDPVGYGETPVESISSLIRAENDYHCAESVRRYQQKPLKTKPVIDVWWGLLGIALFLASAATSIYLIWRLIEWL